MVLFALQSSNCDYSFDAKFLKLLVLIDLFITNMEMSFVQIDHLWKKIIIFLVKTLYLEQLKNLF